MPTSATGADPVPGRRRAEEGFTLVELLVVLTILGMVGAAVLLTMPGGGARLADDAEAFAARLTRAREEAVLSGRPVAVVVDPRGYRFEVLRRGWTALEEAPFGPRVWAEGVAARPDLGDQSRLRFDPDGSATPGDVTLAREARRVRVSVDQAGEVRIDASS